MFVAKRHPELQGLILHNCNVLTTGRRRLGRLRTAEGLHYSCYLGRINRTNGLHVGLDSPYTATGTLQQAIILQICSRHASRYSSSVTLLSSGSWN